MSQLPVSNLLQNLPADLPMEFHETLVTSETVRIDRIVSHGHASELGSWYDQDQAEWVLVLQGEAKLQFESEAELTHLKSGDWISIPAHRRHRVHWTCPDQQTIWLAVYYEN